MKLVKPFIQLPYVFDPSRLEQELRALESQTWLPHPSQMPGNKALPLISRDGGDNDNFDGPMKATAHLEASPYMRQCLAHIGEVFGRSRLMSLAPGAEVSQHVDFNYHWYSRVRIHIPIVTTPDVTFFCGDSSVHMAAGTCWIFDSWRHHRVVNRSPQTRVHLVVDTAGSSSFWNRVASSANGSAGVPKAVLPFDPGLNCQVRTERFNSAPVIAPGEMQALVDDLLDDLRQNQRNDRSVLEALERTLQALVHDWRALWLQHGYSQSAVSDYQRLLQHTVSNLPKQPRALTTHSNDVGAVSIVMQRIIRAALRPDLAHDFLPGS